MPMPPRPLSIRPGRPLVVALPAVLALCHAAPALSDRDTSQKLDANLLSFPITNFGSYGFDIPAGDAGFEFPRGSGKTCLFAAGLWLGARVSGETRVTLAEYAFDYAPGPMAGGTFVPDRPEFRMYKVSADDTIGTAAWMAHAVAQGAPTSAGGTAPGLIGTQTLWSVFNDADPSLHTNHAGRTPPLGIEVRQISWAWEEDTPRGSMAFLRYQLRNAGGQWLDSTYVGLWGDVDLGGASDDRMGSDATRDLSYSYNAPTADNLYGTMPPAIGFVLLEGPRPSPLGAPLHANAVNTYIGGAEPDTALESYRLLLGLQLDGSPWVDPTTGFPTPFVYPGDPVGGTGWFMPFNRELRMMLNVGPFTMAPGDTQQVTMAIIVAQGTNNLDSVRLLRAYADSISLAGSLAPGPPRAHALMLSPPANPATGDLRLTFTAPFRAAWWLDAFDARGRRVARAAQGVGTGRLQTVRWSPGANDLAPGVYWISLSSANDRVTRRIVLLGR